MFEPLAGLPQGVIGFAASGELQASDYTDVLLPTVDRALASGDDVRIVLVFERFDGISGGAMWQDLKMGVEHLTRWKRIALVTDIDRMTHLTSLFGWMTSGEMRHFPLAERAQAIAWAAGSSD